MELSLLPIESTPRTPTEPAPSEVPASTETAAIAEAPAAMPAFVDPPAVPDSPEPGASVVGGAEAPATPATDRYLASATREYEGGKVDRPLWERAVELAGGDHAAAVSGYLRARATAMRIAAREGPSFAARDRKRLSTTEPDTDAATGEAAGVARTSHSRRGPKLRGWPVAAVGVAVLAAAAVWFVSAPRDEGGSNASSSPGASAAPASVAAPAVRSPAPAPARPEADVAAEREAKVQELLRAGNWNVLVLHAAEWTRREPENARAWNHLSVGYANLKQHDEALAAAEKAAQLAPGEPKSWLTLGRMNLSAGRPEPALRAFERAVELDAQDVAALVQLGRANVELGHLPQAKAAFDRVLALSPDDAEALCGQVSVAQRQGRGRDADALLRELGRHGRQCPAETASAAPAPAVAPPARPVSPGSAR